MKPAHKQHNENNTEVEPFSPIAAKSDSSSGSIHNGPTEANFLNSKRFNFLDSFADKNENEVQVLEMSRSISAPPVEFLTSIQSVMDKIYFLLIF